MKIDGASLAYRRFKIPENRFGDPAPFLDHGRQAFTESCKFAALLVLPIQRIVHRRDLITEFDARFHEPDYVHPAPCRSNGVRLGRLFVTTADVERPPL